MECSLTRSSQQIQTTTTFAVSSRLNLDVLQKIFSHISGPNSLLSITLVSNQWNLAMQSSGLWKGLYVENRLWNVPAEHRGAMYEAELRYFKRNERSTNFRAFEKKMYIYQTNRISFLLELKQCWRNSKEEERMVQNFDFVLLSDVVNGISKQGTGLTEDEEKGDSKPSFDALNNKKKGIEDRVDNTKTWERFTSGENMLNIINSTTLVKIVLKYHFWNDEQVSDVNDMEYDRALERRTTQLPPAQSLPVNNTQFSNSLNNNNDHMSDNDNNNNNRVPETTQTFWKQLQTNSKFDCLFLQDMSIKKLVLHQVNHDNIMITTKLKTRVSFHATNKADVDRQIDKFLKMFSTEGVRNRVFFGNGLWSPLVADRQLVLDDGIVFITSDLVIYIWWTWHDGAPWWSC